MERTYTLGLYEKAMPLELDWKEKLISAKEAGFDFMEISIDETEEKLNRLAMPKADRFGLVRLMNDVDLPIRTMCLSGHRKYPLGSHDPEIRQRGMEIMKAAVNLADDLGVRIIQLAGYDVYYEGSDEMTRTNFLENLKKSVELAASHSIILGFETMETQFMNTVEKAMYYVRQISSMYLGVYPDIGNITNAALEKGNDVFADLRTGKGHMAAIHLKETKPGIFREVPYGEGHVDFKRSIETAWELGIRKFVTEFWYTGNEEWKKDLADAGRRMRRILDAQQ